MSGLLESVPAGIPVAVLLDYDGTLVPIRPRPGLARLGPRRRAELARLGRKAFVAIVSGRPLSEIRRMVGVPGLAYIGNHGLEIRFKGRTWVHPGAARRAGAVARTAAAIKARSGDIRGAFVEDKGLTASVHFRAVAARRRAALAEVVAEEVLRSRGELSLSRGKMVFEIKPNVAWDKGRGVLRLLRRACGPGPCFPVYIGDDRTDEDAFRALRRRGLTIRVGAGRGTLARHRVRGVDEVWRFVEALGRRLGPRPVLIRCPRRRRRRAARGCRGWPTSRGSSSG